MPNNKEIVIFGGNGLIGKSLSNFFLKKGKDVIIADLKFDNLHLLKEQHKKELTFMKVNASDISETRNLFTTYPTANKIINLCYPRKAGYGDKLEDVKSNNFSDNISQNLLCYFNVMQSASEVFKESSGCNLINFSSIYGVITPRFEVYENSSMTMPVEYAAIKSSIIHLSRYFSKYYLKQNIKVNCVSPGGIYDNQNENFLENYCKHTDNLGMLQPSDLNETCEFLLNSRNITGQNIIVDNGFSL